MNSSSSHFSHGVKKGEEEKKKKKKIPKGDQSDGFLSNDSRHVTNPPSSSSSLTHAHKSLPASPLMDDRSRKSPFRIVFYSLLNRFSQVLS